LPLPQDNAIFDANSFTGISTLTCDVARLCKSVYMNLVTQQVTINISGSVFGDFILGNNIIPVGVITMMGRGNCNINTYSKTVLGLNIIGGGVYVLQGDLVCLNSIQISWTSTFNANGYNVTTIYYTYNASNGCVTYMGSGTWTFNRTVGGSGASQVYFPPSPLFCETSTLILNNAGSTGPVLFDLFGLTFNKLIIAGSHLGDVNITTGGTINELTINPGRKVRFTAGITTTVGKLTALGTQANPITIGSVTAATHNLIKTGADMVEVEYCNISNSNATPSDKWAAGDTSTDGGGNSGWTFKFIPIIMWFFAIFSKK